MPEAGSATAEPAIKAEQTAATTRHLIIITPLSFFISASRLQAIDPDQGPFFPEVQEGT
jgi:hypothetical protein